MGEKTVPDLRRGDVLRAVYSYWMTLVDGDLVIVLDVKPAPHGTEMLVLGPRGEIEDVDFEPGDLGETWDWGDR